MQVYEAEQSFQIKLPWFNLVFSENEDEVWETARKRIRAPLIALPHYLDPRPSTPDSSVFVS